MGCVSSKQTVSVTPTFGHSGLFRDGNVGHGGGCENGSGWSEAEKKKVELAWAERVSESGRTISKDGESVNFRLGNLQKYLGGEQAAAGWPAWLSTVAGEAIQGWVPLRAEAFEKLEKIGQGTYSSVFRARDHEAGRIVALKKVRFDSFEPESVRFMAREILILRRLDHPNIMKLEGIITSRLSCTIYLVFEYMEHDITGLLSCNNIKFSEAQIKCYMKQLLSGLEHCHSRGVMHRDIKGSNLLVNNEGILKVADFGLANFCVSSQKHPLTSRVVTLWYRPPELLLGSTEYGASVDLWSVGCVFAEIILGKPILQGRTEVEQLHKIFKLCGSPPDDYWKKSKLPHVTLFKPQQPYKSSLRDSFQDLQPSTLDLIETLLSVESHKRGTASSALASEYFKTKPHACDPSSLPVYPPSKEIDARNREEAKRKRGSGARTRGPDTARKSSRKPTNKLAPLEDFSVPRKPAQRHSNGMVHILEEGHDNSGIETPEPSLDRLDDASHVKNASQGDIPFSGPLELSSSSGFAWAKMRKNSSFGRADHNRSTSRSHIFDVLDNSCAATRARSKVDSKQQNAGNLMHGGRCQSRGGCDSSETMKHDVMHKQWGSFERPDSFDASIDYHHSQELSAKLYQREGVTSKRSDLGYQTHADKVEFSGPLLSQPRGIEELLERHEWRIQQAARKSWFQRAKKQGK
ncbi:hypothetical protein SAY86_006791 [Trapa natans]|uniref:Protein kinase domain-containing protein n=1 Tax=Trapa natans TaxID=22666 RepID=A0AAN7KZH1_TRANT|nr:hypothetical protein SAY86_006791 [Trapa natans]